VKPTVARSQSKSPALRRGHELSVLGELAKSELGRFKLAAEHSRDGHQPRSQ
jgi:hypothetical protein